MTTSSMTSDQSVPTHHGAVSIAVMAAVVPTVLSAQGMVAVARDTINLPLGLALGCAIFLELGLVASALLARASVRRGGHAGADGAATWALSALSGSLSALHEVVGREVTGPHLLAAAVRLVAPLVAAWLWHRVLVADLDAAEPRPTRAQARRARLMLAVAAAAAEVERTEDGTGAHARAARRLRARNKALLRHVPGTDPGREPELRAWMTSVGQADIMPAWTRPMPGHDEPAPGATPGVPGHEDPMPGHDGEEMSAVESMPGHAPDMGPGTHGEEARTLVAPQPHPGTDTDMPASPDTEIPQVSASCPGMPGHGDPMPGHGADMPAPDVRLIPSCPDMPAPDVRLIPSCPDMTDPMPGHDGEEMSAVEPMPGHTPDMGSQVHAHAPSTSDMPGRDEPVPGITEEHEAGMPAPVEPMPGHAGDARPDARARHEAMLGHGQDVEDVPPLSTLRARLADELIARDGDATASDLAVLWAAEGAGAANGRTARRHLAQARERAGQLQPALV